MYVKGHVLSKGEWYSYVMIKGYKNTDWLSHY